MIHAQKPYYRYILAFGSNLGNRRQNCDKSIDALRSHVDFLNMSTIKETTPLHSDQYDTSDHNNYYNFVADIATNLRPDHLISLIQQIEDNLGHNRLSKWAPRHIDIDILFWAKNERKDFASCSALFYSGPQNLLIPHYDVWNRPFQFALLNEIGLSQEQLFAHKEP